MDHQRHPACPQCGRPNYHGWRYRGYCLDCHNCGVPDLLFRIESLRAGCLSGPETSEPIECRLVCGGCTVEGVRGGWYWVRRDGCNVSGFFWSEDDARRWMMQPFARFMGFAEMEVTQ